MDILQLMVGSEGSIRRIGGKAWSNAGMGRTVRKSKLAATAAGKTKAVPGKVR